MGRLIDVDRLEKDIRHYADKKCCHGELELAHGILKSLSIIKEQPTAYDVDKVIERLENEPSCGFGFKGLYTKRVIEIVKGAVKDE